ncbi:MAG TPA: response regulator [Candidatus Limnocylindrales bacterium]|nr:response regulator [Candidatus Limnocylindrales bacterium]
MDADGLRLRVLIVDDTPVIRAVVRRILERDGRFEVVGEACDGLEAVDMTEGLQPDLVLLDLAMPRMDGLQALPEIITNAPSVTVVVLSSFSRDQMKDAALDAGALGYVEKDRIAITLVPQIVSVCTSLLLDA